MGMNENLMIKEIKEKIYNAEKMIKRAIKDLKEVLNELGLGDDKNE